MKLIILVFLVTSGPCISQQSSFKIEPDAKVTVHFSVKSFLYGKVKGEFLVVKGVANFNKENIKDSNFDFKINSASVETGKKSINKFISSDDFFSVEKHPTIRFKSTTFIKENNQYIVFGELTLKNIKKNIQIPFNIMKKNGVVFLNGSFKLNRFDFKIGEKYKRFWIKETVTIKIEAVLSGTNL